MSIPTVVKCGRASIPRAVPLFDTEFIPRRGGVSYVSFFRSLGAFQYEQDMTSERYRSHGSGKYYGRDTNMYTNGCLPKGSRFCFSGFVIVPDLRGVPRSEWTEVRDACAALRASASCTFHFGSTPMVGVPAANAMSLLRIRDRDEDDQKADAKDEQISNHDVDAALKSGLSLDLFLHKRKMEREEYDPDVTVSTDFLSKRMVDIRIDNMPYVLEELEDFHLQLCWFGDGSPVLPRDVFLRAYLVGTQLNEIRG